MRSVCIWGVEGGCWVIRTRMLAVLDQNVGHYVHHMNDGHLVWSSTGPRGKHMQQRSRSHKS